MNENIFSQVQQQAGKRKKKRTRKQRRIRLLLIAILAMAVLSAGTIVKDKVQNHLDKKKMGHPGEITEPKQPGEVDEDPPGLTVTVFRCGTGDMVLVNKGETEILIDCGVDPGKLSRFVDDHIEGFICTAPLKPKTRGIKELFSKFTVDRYIAMDDAGYVNFEKGDNQSFDLGDGASVSVLRLHSQNAEDTLACIISDGTSSVFIEGAIDEEKEQVLFADKNPPAYVVAGNNGSTPALNIFRGEREMNFTPIFSCAAPGKSKDGAEISKENKELIDGGRAYATYKSGDITLAFSTGTYGNGITIETEKGEAE